MRKLLYCYMLLFSVFVASAQTKEALTAWFNTTGFDMLYKGENPEQPTQRYTLDQMGFRYFVTISESNSNYESILPKKGFKHVLVNEHRFFHNGGQVRFSIGKDVVKAKENGKLVQRGRLFSIYFDKNTSSTDKALFMKNFYDLMCLYGAKERTDYLKSEFPKPLF